ncbi:MAG: hypothetical protein IT289_12910 [Oligoflexia bacterium]|nr:hypothetical protein [Oligoflexia bacterium]
MIQLLGFGISSFGLSFLILMFLRSKPAQNHTPHSTPPTIQRRVVITFSVVLSMISFSLLVMLFPSVSVLDGAIAGGRLEDVVLGICLVVLTFLISYLYFWRMVRP